MYFFYKLTNSDKTTEVKKTKTLRDSNPALSRVYMCERYDDGSKVKALFKGHHTLSTAGDLTAHPIAMATRRPSSELSLIKSICSISFHRLFDCIENSLIRSL